mgnify:CR=1 FL=1
MVPEKLSAYDAVEIAIGMEKNGAALFQELSETTPERTVAEVFSAIAAEHNKNLKQYQNILKKLSKGSPAEAYPGEYVLYLKNLADEHSWSLSKARGLLPKTHTTAEALEVALNNKKNSLLFLKELEKNLIQEDIVVVQKVIEQKQAGLNKLIELRKKAK